jgi:hypothetical protein
MRRDSTLGLRHRLREFSLSFTLLLSLLSLQRGVKDVPKDMYNEANLPFGSSSVALRQLYLVECVSSHQQVTSAIHSSRNPVH